MPQILVIEDQIRQLQAMTRTLAEAEFDVEGAESLLEANRLLNPDVDLVILDLMVLDGDGVSWLSEIRAAGNRTPVLTLTVREAVQDRVAGLDAGADDCLVKPFAAIELVARVKALLRRRTSTSPALLTFGDLTVDLLTRAVQRGSQAIDLQRRQFELLVYLMRNVNKVVTREMIARDLWSEPDATQSNVIAVHINHLRKKLQLPGHVSILHTARGRGYWLGSPKRP